MPTEKEYPGRPLHGTPEWVMSGAVYHIRVRVAGTNRATLTDAGLAPRLLESVLRYEQQGKWECYLCLLMPDHVHALLAFALAQDMSSVIGSWKRYHARMHGIAWQANYFDHRIRTRRELKEKGDYILRNPVVKGLCATEREWAWWISSLHEMERQAR
jgi:REP element-mobilizing transposase RayT